MKNFQRSTVKCSGFALIATISIMILLVMIALAMLSLSSIELRSGQNGKAMQEAQANARLALMMAIGELQTHTGSDMRVTAPANIVESSAPPMVGVWDSWQGDDHDSQGRPIKPDYASKTQSAASGSGRFISWLVAGAQPGGNLSNPSALASTSASTDSTTVPLLAEGSLGSNPGQIHVPVQLISRKGSTSPKGAYTWWVSPENQKARLQQPYQPRQDDAAGWSELAKTHAVPDPEVIGLPSLLDEPEPHHPGTTAAKPGRKAITLQSTALIEPGNTSEPQRSFHDLSTSSVGLLTNTATGGWRKDLSILTEKWDDIYSDPNRKLPLFRYSPEAGSAATSQVPLPTETNYDPSQSNFYPWSEYVQIGQSKYPMTYHAASASWQSLVNFANSYKTIDYDTTNQVARAPLVWANVMNESQPVNFFNCYHQADYQPVVARIQMILQARAIPDPRVTSNPQNYYRVDLRLVPFFTLWNPYNIQLDKTGTLDIGIGSMRSINLALAVSNASAPPPEGDTYKLLSSGDYLGIDGPGVGPGNGYLYDDKIQGNIDKGYGNYSGNAMRFFGGWLPLEYSLQPGEVKMFAPGFNNFLDQNTSGIRLKEGYEATDDVGAAFLISQSQINSGQLGSLIKPGSSRKGDNVVYSSDTLKFSIRADRLSKIYSDMITTKSGAGSFYSVGSSIYPLDNPVAEAALGACPKGIQTIRSVMAASIDDEWAQEYWPADELVDVTYRVDELTPGGGNRPWTNIVSISFGPRFTMGGGSGNAQNRPTKGMLQSSPFVLNSYSIPEQEPSFHPANGSVDFSFHTLTPNNSITPEVGMEGFICTGFQSGDGISRLVMAELPLRPIASLGELQSWNLRGQNPLPPFQYNLIGNSEATPMIPMDGILPSNLTGIPAGDPEISKVTKNLQHDDAYCANHLLFDDWFCSTIAPLPDDFGSSIYKDIETVYRDFLSGDQQLTNRAYQAVPDDLRLSSGAIDDRVEEILNSHDGWLKVASRFQVDGMFNVNSTSVKAWRALLGHARKQQVAHHTKNGITLDTAEGEHVVSRHTVASDVKAGAAPGMGAAFPSGSEYAGFRTLSDDQLDQLAEKVVEQVRKRGPFLSLSEFVNRQLGSNEDLALAGALQAALDSLTGEDDPMKNLRDPANHLSSVTMDANSPKIDGAGYAFKKASEGMSTHGLPGWIRQADILRPIAPILSARDDTFTIRTYGDARDAAGKVLARAWCEATVTRTRNFVDGADSADQIDPPTSDANQKFGRRYKVVSFRWLNADEV